MHFVEKICFEGTLCGGCKTCWCDTECITDKIDRIPVCFSKGSLSPAGCSAWCLNSGLCSDCVNHQSGWGGFSQNVAWIQWHSQFVLSPSAVLCSPYNLHPSFVHTLAAFLSCVLKLWMLIGCMNVWPINLNTDWKNTQLPSFSLGKSTSWKPNWHKANKTPPSP